jgi:hypothetical protein
VAGNWPTRPRRGNASRLRCFQRDPRTNKENAASNWPAGAEAVNAPMAELAVNPRELAERSRVSLATIREIQPRSTVGAVPSERCRLVAVQAPERRLVHAANAQPDQVRDRPGHWTDSGCLQRSGCATVTLPLASGGDGRRAAQLITGVQQRAHPMTSP